MKSMLIVALLLSTVVISCGGDSATTPSATATLTPETEKVEIEMLLQNANEYDGKMVEVQGAFWSDGAEQYLTDVLMESYPPQISKTSAILLIGEIPTSVLDQLEHSEPPFGDVIWGSVIVTGLVQLDSETGRASLDVHSIEVV